MEKTIKNNKIIMWILRVIPAFILLQTLYFKFTAHPDSVALFSELGAEPIGRIGTGILELIAGALLLIPGTTKYGALLSLGIISGAIASHLFILGIEFNGDGGTLFMMAMVVFVTSLILVILHKKELLSILKRN